MFRKSRGMTDTQAVYGNARKEIIRKK
jgi:hypothetical protein